MRKSLLFITLCLGSMSLFAQNVVRGPYLQNPTPSSIVVRWPTDSKVQFGSTLAGISNTILDTTTTTEHRVVVSGLQPKTSYSTLYLNCFLQLSDFTIICVLQSINRCFKFWIILANYDSNRLCAEHFANNLVMFWIFRVSNIACQN